MRALWAARRDVADRNVMVYTSRSLAAVYSFAPLPLPVQIPDALVSDLALRGLSVMRPATTVQVREIGGLSERALALFAEPLAAAVARFCAAAKHIKAGEGLAWTVK